MGQLKTVEGIDQVMFLVGKEVEPSSESHDIVEEVKLSIEHDEKDVFLDAVKRQLGINKYGFSTCDLSRLWSLICRKKSTNCAAALLENDIGLDFDVNVALIDEMRPLHLAAENLSPSLVKLFLDHRAKTNLYTGDGKLPLTVALERISCHYLLADWTPEKSVGKLVYLLCLGELVEPLEVAKLLSGNVEEVQSVAKQCIEDGNIVQLAALLVVARKKLLESVSCNESDGSALKQWIISGNESDGSALKQWIVSGNESDGSALKQWIVSGNESDGSALKQQIMKKLARLIRLESQLIVWGHKDKIKSVEQHMNLMVSAMQVLAIFEMAGGDIENYWLGRSGKNSKRDNVASEIFAILCEYGFSCEKHTNFNVTTLEPEEEEEFKKSLLAKMPPMTSLPRPVHLGSMQSPEQLSAISLLHNLRVPGRQVRSIHTCARAKSNSGFRLFAISGSQVNQSHAVMDPHPPLPKFITKRFYALASTITRRIHF